MRANVVAAAPTDDFTRLSGYALAQFSRETFGDF